MPAPLPKTFELIEILGPSLQSGECLLNEIELRRAFNEASKIPLIAERFFVQALIRLIQGNDDMAYDFFDRALSIEPNNEQIWINYVKSVHNKGYVHKTLSILESAIKHPFPLVLAEAYEKGTTWGRVSMASEAKKKLEMMGIFEKMGFPVCLHELYENFSSLGDESDDFQGICRIISEVAEKHKVQVVGNRIEFRDLISFISLINSSDDELLSEMNSEVIDIIVSRGLVKNNCIGYFDATGVVNG